MKKGFTFLEILVVIIIIGVLATLGFNQYTRMMEKSRTAEAKTILSQLRGAQLTHLQDESSYGVLADLSVEVPSTCAGQASHYFQYSCNAGNGSCIATRCTGINGKQPGALASYWIRLFPDGTWDGTPGYY